MPTSFIRSTIDFLQSSFSGFFAAKSSKIAVTSTACGGAAAAEEGVAGAAGVVGLVGVAAATVGVGEATAEEAGAALLDGAAVVCPNIFDMRFVNIPIAAKHTPHRDRKRAPVIRLATAQIGYHICHLKQRDDRSKMGHVDLIGAASGPEGRARADANPFCCVHGWHGGAFALRLK